LNLWLLSYLLRLHCFEILINLDVWPEIFKKIKHHNLVHKIRKEKTKKSDPELHLHPLEILLLDVNLHFEHLHEISFELGRRFNNRVFELLLRFNQLVFEFVPMR
jgi:hypothetical protein